MAWEHISSNATNKIFGIEIYNTILNNLGFLKTLFSAEHNWSSGTHKRPGAYAFATLFGAGASAPTTTAATRHNVETTVVRNGVGDYTVELSDKVPPYSVLLLSNSLKLRNASGFVNGNKVQIKFQTSAGAAVDVTSGHEIYFAILKLE